MRKRVSRILLVLIVVAAFFLRFYRIAQIPPSLNWDEISIGYNAYSVLKTGRDEWGKLLPLHFKSYGEYKLPAQIYASIPGIAVFGLNELGVRITPVVYGTTTVLFLYFLVDELFKNKNIALIASFLLAVSPWHIQLTRASFESSFSVFWVVLGIWLLIKGFKNEKYWPLSAIAFVISVYTYNSARIFSPLFLFVIFLVYKKQILKKKKAFLLSILIFIALVLPLVPFSLSGEAAARYKLVSITNEAGLVPRINERRGNSTLPGSLPRLIHNKVTYISFYFVQNYLNHFTPDYLFVSGAPHRQHHVQNVGQLYAVQAPFVILGIYWLFKNKNKFRWLIISWILIAFIPVSMTKDSIPHALRTLIAAPPYQILTALGIWLTFTWIKRKSLRLVLATALTGAFVVGFGSYLNNFYNVYPAMYSRDWQYGYKQVVDYIGKHDDEYDQIVFSRHYGEPHMFTLFYLNWDPASYQNDPSLVRFQSHDWVWVTHFDKFYFPDLGDEGTRFAEIVGDNPGKKLLFIGKSGDFPEDKEKLLTVDFLNGQRAFEIVDVR